MEKILKWTYVTCLVVGVGLIASIAILRNMVQTTSVASKQSDLLGFNEESYQRILKSQLLQSEDCPEKMWQPGLFSPTTGKLESNGNCIPRVDFCPRGQRAVLKDPKIKNDYKCISMDFSGAAIEEHGKIAVAQMPHTGELVRKYGAANVQVSALGYGLIKDEDYIRGMLGDQFGVVDCILQVKWPDGERIYIEVLLSDDRDGEMEYIALTPSEFEQAAASASSAMWETFYVNINADQTYVLPYLLAHE